MNVLPQDVQVPVTLPFASVENESGPPHSRHGRAGGPPPAVAGRNRPRSGPEGLPRSGPDQRAGRSTTYRTTLPHEAHEVSKDVGDRDRTSSGSSQSGHRSPGTVGAAAGPGSTRPVPLPASDDAASSALSSWAMEKWPPQASHPPRSRRAGRLSNSTAAPHDGQVLLMLATPKRPRPLFRWSPPLRSGPTAPDASRGLDSRGVR